MNKLCVTVAGVSFKEVLLLVQRHNFVELRLDKLILTCEELAQAIDIAQNSIVSCVACDANFTFEKLNSGIAAGANIIDVPYEFLNTIFFKELKEKLNKTKIKLIISYHNFLQKDTNETLLYILNNMKNVAQPDYYKIATMCETYAEIESFFKLFKMKNEFRELVLVPMSLNYPRARVDAIKLGSPYMYCFDENFSFAASVAPGQLSVVTMKNMLYRHN